MFDSVRLSSLWQSRSKDCLFIRREGGSANVGGCLVPGCSSCDARMQEVQPVALHAGPDGTCCDGACIWSVCIVQLKDR
jgi:hypothetical protein